MRKLFFTSLFALFIGLSYSQTLIPKVGVAFGKFVGSDAGESEFSLGFTGGLGFNLPIGKGVFSFQPELNFIQKGEKATVAVDQLTIWKLRPTINYLELPILLKASFGTNAMKFYLNAGPSIGLGLGGKVKVSYMGTDAELEVQFGKPDFSSPNFNPEYFIEKRFEFGVHLGGGIIVVNKIMIDARYCPALSSLYENSEIRNNVLQFTVGVPINLN